MTLKSITPIKGAKSFSFRLDFRDGETCEVRAADLLTFGRLTRAVMEKTGKPPVIPGYYPGAKGAALDFRAAIDVHLEVASEQ